MYRFTYRLPHAPFPAPSRNENMYALRLEIQERMARTRRLQQERKEEERVRLRELHHDHCPECGSELSRLEVGEGTVRQCPSCRGVFMEQAMFARLTHPESEEAGYLTQLFRDFLLEWTTGSIPKARPPGS